MAGQTLTEIRGLLAAAGLAPRHRYGQNFLIDLNLMGKVVAAGELHADDVVLEVGCGTGSLSELLLASGARVVGVELDRGLQAVLRDRLGSNPRFTLVQGDALAGKHAVNPLMLTALAQHPPGPGGHRKLVANLPYQIATPLLVELLQVQPAFERLTCTIQREVGERLAAAAGSEAYGPVSVMAQSLGRIELLAILPPSAFWPRPQVESVLITIRPDPEALARIEDLSGFVRLVHDAFAQRRKMLRRLFRDWDPLAAMAVLGRAGVSPDDRPETIAPGQWLRLHAEVLRAGPP
jgi:16S rRNA (adenine1518-N6/adenine1519-N6)-dimethyltransferase